LSGVRGWLCSAAGRYAYLPAAEQSQPRTPDNLGLTLFTLALMLFTASLMVCRRQIRQTDKQNHRREQCKQGVYPAPTHRVGHEGYTPCLHCSRRWFCLSVWRICRRQNKASRGHPTTNSPADAMNKASVVSDKKPRAGMTISDAVNSIREPGAGTLPAAPSAFCRRTVAACRHLLLLRGPADCW
jgi:hypothetical protein